MLFYKLALVKKLNFSRYFWDYVSVNTDYSYRASSFSSVLTDSGQFIESYFSFAQLLSLHFSVKLLD